MRKAFFLLCVFAFCFGANQANAAAGNAWHFPWEMQPGLTSMRQPTFRYYTHTPLVLYSGNQYQGSGGTPGNQLVAGSALFYRITGSPTWLEATVQLHSDSGNNRYYVATVPPGAGQPGQQLEYYFRAAYSDHDTTYIYASGVAWSTTTLNENTARANPFKISIQQTPPPSFPSPADWRDINIYQIFTDRFNDGDPSNNTLSPSSYVPTDGRRIHGGDFKGIEQKLDYIKALGANAIWISPIVLNVGHGAYHGYAAHDFYSLSPHWGSLEDLRSMVSNAHMRGIYVLLDVVAGHTGNRIGSSDPAWGNTFSLAGYPLQWNNINQQYPPPFNQLDHFHNHGSIANQWFDPPQILGEFPGGLDDLKTESDYVRHRMVEIYSYWIEQANLDGFRIDTVKHVDMGFWQHFNPAIRTFASSIGKSNFFQFGEVYDGDEGKLGSYTGTQAGGAYANDSVLDFALHFQVNSVFARADGNTKQIEDHYNAIATHYHADARMRLVTFLDNHDVTRFMNSANANNNTSRLHVATSFLYSSRGIPCLYYGTEQNFNGGGDPNNREDMFAGQFPSSGPSFGDAFRMTDPTYRHVAMLNNFRRVYPSLRRGTHVNRWNTPGGPGLFAYARVLDGEEVFVVFNTAASTRTLDPRPTSYPAGTVLVNLLQTNEMITVTSGVNGMPSISVPGSSTKMFIAASRWLPLDPVVTQQAPVHATSSFVPSQPIVLHFSKPMNTGSVENAFTLNPTASGSFSWSGDRRIMTFTPSGPGLAGQQRYALRVQDRAVDAEHGQPVYGGFETFFVTGVNVYTDTVPPSVTVHIPLPGSMMSNTITIAGTAADNVLVDRVEVRLDFNDWVVATGTTVWSAAMDTRLVRNGSHTLGIRAVDSSGNTSAREDVLIWVFNVPAGYQQRISAGNPVSVTDCEGRVWVQDQAYSFGSFGYLGGLAGNLANSISGICAQAQSLYQRERYGPDGSAFRYRFDCPPGNYSVALLQAENWVSGAGQRLFDIRIQDQNVATNFDIFVLAGGRASPQTSTYNAIVEDGHLEIEFLPKVQNPRVAGIEVTKISDLDSSGDGIPDWWMYGHFDHAYGTEADQSQPEDDHDGDGQSNREEYIAGTSPIDPDSYLHIDRIDLIPEVRLQVGTITGRRYTIDYAENVADPQWLKLGESVMGDGTTRSMEDTGAAPQRIYRIRVDRLE